MAPSCFSFLPHDLFLPAWRWGTVTQPEGVSLLQKCAYSTNEPDTCVGSE